jgi:hypothetical protein
MMGHDDMRKNVLTALAASAHECGCETEQDHVTHLGIAIGVCTQAIVLAHSKKLARGLLEIAIAELTGPEA